MHLYFVEGTDFGITLQFFFPFFDDIAAFLGNGWYGIHFFPLFLIEDGRHFLAILFFDETLGMADAGRHAYHDRDAIGFADFIGFFGHVDTFLRIRRLEHGDFGKLGIIAVILFILG